MAALTVKLADEHRDDICRTVRNAEKKRGITNPNTGPGSDVYVRGQAVGNQLEGLGYGVQQAGEDAMPDTTSGTQLDRWLNAIGQPRRKPGPSNGFLKFVTAATTPVGTGEELLTPSGARFFVVVGGLFADGDPIAIQSRDVGKNQNLDGGTVLRWVTPPPFADSTAAVTSDGTSGGVDAEDDETARNRLLDYLAHPPQDGNASDVAISAQSGAVEIQKAFVYPAANGPDTTHVAVVGYATASNVRSRQVSSTGVALAIAAVAASYPEHVELVLTSATDLDADVTFQLQIPAAASAASGGSGGGWIDAVPFPSISGITAARIYAAVISVTSTTAIRVESMAAPTIGQSVSYIAYSNEFKLYTAKVVSSATHLSPSGGTPGQYDVVLDAPLVGIIAGDYVFPTAARTQPYVDALLASFAKFGPGEKTNVAGVLPRALRRPRPFEQYPYALGAQVLKAVEDAGTEVLSAIWGYQNGGATSPPLPTAISDPPSIFIPRRIGFYQDPSS